MLIPIILYVLLVIANAFALYASYNKVYTQNELAGYFIVILFIDLISLIWGLYIPAKNYYNDNFKNEFIRFKAYALVFFFEINIYGFYVFINKLQSPFYFNCFLGCLSLIDILMGGYFIHILCNGKKRYLNIDMTGIKEAIISLIIIIIVNSPFIYIWNKKYLTKDQFTYIISFFNLIRFSSVEVISNKSDSISERSEKAREKEREKERERLKNEGIDLGNVESSIDENLYEAEARRRDIEREYNIDRNLYRDGNRAGNRDGNIYESEDESGNTDFATEQFNFSKKNRLNTITYNNQPLTKDKSEYKMNNNKQID